MVSPRGNWQFPSGDCASYSVWGEGGLSGDLRVGLLRTADVVVTWKMSNGGNCPSGMLTDKVKEVQESCATGTATLASIVPGHYVVELDSRVETPKVMGTKNVWLKEGEKAQVALQF